MAWFAGLSPDMIEFLAGPGGSLASGLVCDFTTGLLTIAGRKVHDKFKKPGLLEALHNAAAAALDAALSGWKLDKEESVHYRGLFQDWILSPAVLSEFRKLLVPRRNNALDVELLADEFEASGLKVEYLDKMDFQDLALDMVQTFYDAAAGDPRLREPLKLDLLRQMVADVAEMADLLKRQADAGEESLDELKKIRLISNDVAQGHERGNTLLEAIKDILEETRHGVYSERAAYRTVMDALGRSGLEDDQDMTSELSGIRGLLETIRDRLVSRGKAPAPDDLADMEDNYRQSLVDRFGTLTFKGITPSGKAIALPLATLYVELKAVADAPEAADTYSAEERRMLLDAEKRGGPGRDEMSLHLDSLRLERWKKDARTRETRLERRSITETIQNPTRRGVVILGDPGSGKTTLLHHVAMTLAVGINTTGALPIFVPLAAYDDYLSRVGNDAPLGEFIALYHEKWQNMPGLAPLFQRALGQGRAVLLLDGLDEVLETATRQFVAGQTEALIRQWTGKGNRCVVTSRVVGYREAPLPQSLPHLTVLDFGQPEIEIFVHQWCLAYETWVQGRETPTAVQQAKFEEDAFLEDVRSNPSVERLAANPLLLTMLALLRRQVGKLPDRRIELYERYVRTLIDNWRDARSMGARHKAPSRFAPHKAIAYLIELALWLQRNKPSGTARGNELSRVIQTICLNHTGECPDINEAPGDIRVAVQKEAGDFIKDMRYFAGLLAERGRNAFGFLHLTFQEYFAGRALARMDQKQRWEIIKPPLARADPSLRRPVGCGGAEACRGRRTGHEHPARQKRP